MKTLFVPIFIAMLGYSEFTGAQNFIGLQKNEIISLMKEKHSNFKQNNDFVNKSYKYLKFEDKITEQTILFFLSETDECTLVRWMSDYSNINEMIAMLNEKYAQTGKNSWSYTENNKIYSVTLEDSEWYFTVSFKLKK